MGMAAKCIEPRRRFKYIDPAFCSVKLQYSKEQGSNSIITCMCKCKFSSIINVDGKNDNSICSFYKVQHM